MLECQAADCSGRQEAGCGHPPSHARSQKREPAFRVLLKDKSSRNAAFIICRRSMEQSELLNRYNNSSKRITIVPANRQRYRTVIYRYISGREPEKRGYIMKTRYKVLIIIACVFVVVGIVGTTLIRYFFFQGNTQPDSFYSRAEAEYLLEKINGEEAVLPDADTDAAKTEGFSAADSKAALQVLLHMKEEQVTELIQAQYDASEDREPAEASEKPSASGDGNGQPLAFLHKAKDTHILSVEEFRGFYEYLLEASEDSNVQVMNLMLLDAAEAEAEDGTRQFTLITPEQNYTLAGYEEAKQEALWEDLSGAIDHNVRVYVQDDRILEYIGISSEAVVLTNVWIEALNEQEVQVFLKGYHKTFSCNLGDMDAEKNLEQNLADLRVDENGVTDIVLKSDILTAKVLSVAEDGVELEGYGKLGLSEHYKIYKIYGELAVEPTSQILVGYNTTNFVVADGVIEAALITEPIKAENIRVVLENSDYTSLIHEVVTITSEAPFTLNFQNQQKVFEAGEVLELNYSSGYLADGRVVISSNEENGKLQITSITRNGVNPSYRGTLEVAPYEEGGLTIVNELSLEEYLYTVVPSEMPTSYGNVALEVQAICARGYAYMKMQDGTYAKYGAHVDDSTMTQVYNAVGETEEAILAVKETYGMVPTYNGSVIQAYFFSTSCGTTCTNADVWDGEALPYLQDNIEGLVSANDGDAAADDMAMIETAEADFSDETAFRSFIDDSSSYHTFEKDCSLYRWSIEYTREDMTNAVNATLSSRYAANPDKVLTLQADGSYQSQQIDTVGEVQQITITERGKSGIVKEIQVVGSQATILVRGQSNARALMTPADVVIKRQDGSESIEWSLLPSPFYYVTVNDAGNYVIVGGGFGHGVGMSQNGTKALADMGYSAEAIIKHYYTGVDIVNIYQ